MQENSLTGSNQTLLSSDLFLASSKRNVWENTEGRKWEGCDNS